MPVVRPETLAPTLTHLSPSPGGLCTVRLPRAPVSCRIRSSIGRDFPAFGVHRCRQFGRCRWSRFGVVHQDFRRVGSVWKPLLPPPSSMPEFFATNGTCTSSLRPGRSASAATGSLRFALPIRQRFTGGRFRASLTFVACRTGSSILRLSRRSANHDAEKRGVGAFDELRRFERWTGVRPGGAWEVVVPALVFTDTVLGVQAVVVDLFFRQAAEFGRPPSSLRRVLRLPRSCL